MGERGIIMTGASVRAIQAGTKTQTRRPVRFPSWAAGCFDDPPKIEIETDEHGRDPEVICNDTGCLAALPLPWRNGDQLWVKEALGRRTASFLGIEATNGVEEAFYKADGADVVDEREFNVCPWWRGPTLSPIHMPRWASRLTLIVTDVRVERLQDISEADARAEGVESPETEREAHDWSVCPDCGGTGLHGSLGQSLGYVEVDCSSCRTHRDRYRHLWNGSDAWDRNPWVAALAFMVDRSPASRAVEEVE